LAAAAAGGGKNARARNNDCLVDRFYKHQPIKNSNNNAMSSNSGTDKKVKFDGTGDDKAGLRKIFKGRLSRRFHRGSIMGDNIGNDRGSSNTENAPRGGNVDGGKVWLASD
jgi:hypothetical protein